jgi:excinuclease UvrABC ATPase subunit
MDEPTRGLHALEVKLLLRLLANRVRDGWLVVVVEHNPYFLEDCPLLWTLGPQAGVLGGELTVIEQ